MDKALARRAGSGQLKSIIRVEDMPIVDTNSVPCPPCSLPPRMTPYAPRVRERAAKTVAVFGRRLFRGYMIRTGASLLILVSCGSGRRFAQVQRRRRRYAFGDLWGHSQGPVWYGRQRILFSAHPTRLTTAAIALNSLTSGWERKPQKNNHPQSAPLSMLKGKRLASFYIVPRATRTVGYDRAKGQRAKQLAKRRA